MVFQPEASASISKRMTKRAAAIFQFFYSSNETDLPYRHVPTRDVTNSQGQGHKTEPNLERGMENWCACRPRPITAAAKLALSFEANGTQHYVVLTTRHPQTQEAIAVGLMPFSKKAFTAALGKYRNRWRDRLPYVSDRRLKLLSFGDAFPLHATKSKDGKRHVPGSRYAPIHVPDELLPKLRQHFASKKNRTNEFLRNVCFLEERLAKENASAFIAYSSRNARRANGPCK
jgi:hypothetical protein